MNLHKKQHVPSFAGKNTLAANNIDVTVVAKYSMNEKTKIGYNVRIDQLKHLDQSTKCQMSNESASHLTL